MEQGKFNIGSFVLTIIITAIVSGGGVYMWQKSQIIPPKQEQESTQQAVCQQQIVETSDYEYDFNTGNLISAKDNKIIYTFSDAGKPDKFTGRPDVYIYGLDGSRLIFWQTGFDNSPGPTWDYEIWLTDELEYLDLHYPSQLQHYIVPEYKKQEVKKVLELLDLYN